MPNFNYLNNFTHFIAIIRLFANKIINTANFKINITTITTYSNN